MGLGRRMAARAYVPNEALIAHSARANQLPSVFFPSPLAARAGSYCWQTTGWTRRLLLGPEAAAEAVVVAAACRCWR